MQNIKTCFVRKKKLVEIYFLFVTNAEDMTHSSRLVTCFTFLFGSNQLTQKIYREIIKKQKTQFLDMGIEKNRNFL